MSTTRVKDAGFLQQHIEKLILAAGALVLIAAVVLFFVLDPFSLKVGNKDYSSADEAVNDLKIRDQELKTKMGNQNQLDDPQVPNFRENYEQMMAQSIKAPEPIARLARFGLTDKALNPIIPEPQRYAMVYPPVPKDVKYKFGYDVLDTEFNPDAVARFFELWGRSQNVDEPADFPMVVLAGEFDIWEWVNRLKGESKTAPKGEGTPIPVGIWSKRFGIAGVAILSEEWDEQAQRWTNRRIVEALPGQVRVLPSDKAPVGVNESLLYIEQMRQAREQIAQPELPWVMDFVQITPPGGDELRDGADGFDEFGIELTEGNLGPTERRIKDLQDKILQLQERQRQRDERLRPDRPDRPGRPVRPGRGGDEFDGGFDGGFDPAPGGRGTGERTDRLAVQIEGIQAQIEQLRPRADRERDERQRQAEARRIREEQAKRAAAERRAALEQRGLADPGFEAGFGLEGIQLEEGATVRVWAADPTMRPGKTYRYKLLVAVINPLYGVPRLESEQLAENQDRAAIFPTQAEIDKMPWSDPITVEPRARFFFTSGNENKAKVEVFRRYEGKLETSSFDVAPGDPIGGKVTIKDKEGINPDITVDMNVGAVLVDIEKRRDVRGNTVFTMIYMNEDGSLFERSQAYDSNDPDRRELQREIKEGPTFDLRPAKDEQRFDEFGDGFGPIGPANF